MKKIEKQILENFRNGNSISLSVRDRVESGKYTLWGNPVVESDGCWLVLWDCGWPTKTTASRLNAFLADYNARKEGSSIRYRYAGAGGFYCNGVKFESGCIVIDASTGEFVR